MRQKSTVFKIFLNFCRIKSKPPNKREVPTCFAYLFFFFSSITATAIPAPAAKTAPALYPAADALNMKHGKSRTKAIATVSAALNTFDFIFILNFPKYSVPVF